MTTDAGELISARLKISGRVQGVFFRAETAQVAAQAGVAGWVRNCSDGCVEALVIGSKLEVESVVRWCRHGPSMARVDKLEVEWGEVDKRPERFEIR